MTINDVIRGMQSEEELSTYLLEWLRGLVEEYGRSVIDRCAELVDSRIKHTGSKEDPLDEIDVALELIVADLRSMKP